MRDSAPYRLTERRQAILRQASAALRGRMVTLWRMASGFAVAEVASQPTVPRDLIDAEFALNEGGGGRNDENGKPLLMAVQSAEKFPQNYTMEVTNLRTIKTGDLVNLEFDLIAKYLERLLQARE